MHFHPSGSVNVAYHENIIVTYPLMAGVGTSTMGVAVIQSLSFPC